MKKKFILLPITLTALAPAISLVGCGDPDTPEPPKPTPPTPYAIYTLDKKSFPSPNSELFETNDQLYFKKDKIYQIVINYSMVEQEYWTPNQVMLDLHDVDSMSIPFNVLYIDIDGVVFKDGVDEQNPYFQYAGYTLFLCNYSEYTKDSSILSMYISINSNRDDVNPEFRITKPLF